MGWDKEEGGREMGRSGDRVGRKREVKKGEEWKE